MPAKLTRSDNTLELDLSGCRGVEFKDTKDKIKEIPGRRWHPESKKWLVPWSVPNAERIMLTIRPDTSEEIRDAIIASKADYEESLTSAIPDDADDLLIPWAYKRCEWQPETVNDEPFVGLLPYQRAAVSLMARRSRTLLADDMGLGKTIQAISAVAESLLRCCYEAAAFEQMGTGEPRRASEALSNLLTALQAAHPEDYPGSEAEAMRRLWGAVSAGSDGPGPCDGDEVVFSRSVDEADGSVSVQLARRSRAGRDFEVRGTLPELSPHAALALGAKLVVAPSSVKGAWKRELERWLGPDVPVVVVQGRYSKSKTQTADEKRAAAIQEGIDENAWIIVNWEQLRVKKERVKKKNGGSKTVKFMKEPLFENTEWLAVIGDEVHRAKNPKAQQTEGLWRCQAPLMAGATGTPIMNSPDELWSILRWLWPNEFHELGQRKNAIAYWTFYFDYVDFYEDHYNRKVITGVKNPDALRFVLSDKLIRRTAAILGLKGRKRIRYPVELTKGQQKLYDEAETAMWLAVEKDIAAGNQEAIAFAREMIEKGDQPNVFQIQNGASRLVRLRQIIENCALLGGDDDSAIMDDFEQKFEDSKPAQWVVFCNYKDSCHLLADRLRRKFDVNVAVYNGDVHPGDRTKMEDAFLRGEIDVMIGTIAAMYQGINLQSAHLQYWLSEDYVPAINEQGEARCDRMGQKELVRVYRPYAVATVSEGSVRNANKLKEKIVSTIIPKDDIKEDHS